MFYEYTPDPLARLEPKGNTNWRERINTAHLHIKVACLIKN